MAKRTLINNKTKVQIKVDDHEKIMKQHPGVFKLIPNASISNEVSKKEADIVKEVTSPQDEKPKKSNK